MASHSSSSRTISIDSSSCSSNYLPKELKPPRNQPSNVSKKPNISQTNGEESDPVYACRICSKTFNTIQGLCGHQNAHRGHKLFEIKRPASKSNDQTVDLDDPKGKKELQLIDQQHPHIAHYRRDNVEFNVVENDIHVDGDIDIKGKTKVNNEPNNLHHLKFNLHDYDDMVDLKIGNSGPSKNLLTPRHSNPSPTLNLFPMSPSIKRTLSHPSCVSPMGSYHPTQRAYSNQMTRVSNTMNTNFIRNTQGGYVPFHVDNPVCYASHSRGLHRNMIQVRPNKSKVHNFGLEQGNTRIEEEDLDLELRL